jgi:hypothetical protein
LVSTGSLDDEFHRPVQAPREEEEEEEEEDEGKGGC